MSDPHSLPDPATVQPPRGLARTGLIIGGLALAVVAGGLVLRHHDAEEAQERSDKLAVPSVHLVLPESAGKSDELVLPGTMQAWTSAHIYARVAGYVRAWYKDIGATVSEGQPLGAIDTPELDQQIIQARATLVRAKAEATLARSTSARWKDLLKSNAVSIQETDEKNADAATHNAQVQEAAAALGRLVAMKAYATVRAPFSGIVTQRNSDIGDLVGPGAATQTPMFAMVDEHRMRIYVNVPQQYSAAMHAGQSATLQVPDYPGHVFNATVLDQSFSINPQSGALQVQLATDNPGTQLKAGGYAEVHFALPVAANRVTIPSGALVLRGGGTQVATIGVNGRIHLVPVVLGRDLGGKVEVAAGLTPQTRIVANPPDSISEGEVVKVDGSHG